MKLLAWASFILAIIAGAGLAVNDAGLVQVLAIIVVLVAVAIDIGKDREPNQVAVLAAIVVPSLLVLMPGKLASTLSGLLKSAWNNTSGHLGSWAGTTSTLGVAAVCVAVSFVIAQRTMNKGKGF